MVKIAKRLEIGLDNLSGTSILNRTKSKKYLLFTPGPVNVEENVRMAICKEDICHREQDFDVLLANSSIKELTICRVPHQYRGGGSDSDLTGPSSDLEVRASAVCSREVRAPKGPSSDQVRPSAVRSGSKKNGGSPSRSERPRGRSIGAHWVRGGPSRSERLRCALNRSDRARLNLCASDRS